MIPPRRSSRPTSRSSRVGPRPSVTWPSGRPSLRVALPSRVLLGPRSPALASPRPRVLSRTYAPVQSFSPVRYHPYGLDGPASPFLSADLAVFSRRASPFRDLAFRALLSSGYAALQSIPRTTLARIRVSVAGPSPGLCLPTAHAETRVHTHGPSRPLRSAFRVWLPS
jgi:hypothetical protein